LLKRTLDVVVSAVLLLLLSPLLALLAATVLLDSGRPVLYSQIRVGRGFRPFRIWKFRSMRTNHRGPHVTVRGDSRLTRAGKLLRAAKLDELPQLWNVLRGDMSLVGPRPEVPEYVSLYRERYRAVLSVRPGITDLASIRFRDEEAVLAAAEDPLAEYADRILPAKLDLAEEYVRSRSMRLDLSILWRTLSVTLRPS
jgi:lipopolysaccharide/colanic/teichoic acid biosynthesis glycosyltransferase